MKNKIIQNAIQTPDGTIILSRSVHDYQTYDGYMVDGGNDYNQTISASLGKLDLSIRPGDRIKEVKNSELEDGTGGYYNLDTYVESLSISRDGDADAYTVSLSIKNRDSFGSLTNTVRSN